MICFHRKMILGILHLTVAFQTRAQKINIIEPIILKYLANQLAMKLIKLIMIYYPEQNSLINNQKSFEIFRICLYDLLKIYDNVYINK